MVSLHKSIHFMPQTATSTLFSTPIPEILHFSWFGFKPWILWKCNKCIKNVINVIVIDLNVIDILSLKKKVVSSA